MAVAAAAQLLDELMGRSRNDGDAVKKKEIKWEDPEYCKYYMVKFCPHDMFVNTKADLGPCPNIHCEEARSQFQEAEMCYLKTQYEDEFIRFAQGMLNEVERKIIKGEQRLALMGKSEPPPQLTNSQTQKNEEQVQLLSEKIDKLVQEAEQAGIQGKVEEAQGLMMLCDQLKDEREALQRQNENSHWSATVELAVAQEKLMEVCKVCGAFLIVGDAQSRIDDHLMGKQHTGYGRLKTAVEELVKEREDRKLERQRKRDEKNRRTSERGRDERRDRDSKSEKSRSPRRRSADRAKDRDRKRDDRSRSRHNRSHSRHDRSRSSRHRSRSRDQRRDHRKDDRHRSSSRYSDLRHRERGVNGDRRSDKDRDRRRKD